MDCRWCLRQRNANTDANTNTNTNTDTDTDTNANPRLNPNNPPGKNFNLAPFTLQLPTGSSGSVDTESGANLAAGYTNQYYFYTDSGDGSMVMMDPTTGWTTSGSLQSPHRVA